MIKTGTFCDDDVIEIEDAVSGDTYFYEVEVNLDSLPSIIDLRLMISDMEY